MPAFEDETLLFTQLQPLADSPQDLISFLSRELRAAGLSVRREGFGLRTHVSETPSTGRTPPSVLVVNRQLVPLVVAVQAAKRLAERSESGQAQIVFALSEEPAAKWYEDAGRIFGLSLCPALSPEQVGINFGDVFPALLPFELRVKPPEGAPSTRSAADRCIGVAAEIVTSVRAALSRFTDPLTPTVVTFHAFETGDDGGVRVTGVFRIAGREERARPLELLREIARGLTEPVGLSFALTGENASDFVQVAPEVSLVLQKSAEAVFGRSNVLAVDYMAPDAAWLAPAFRSRPASLLYLGVPSVRPSNLDPSLHACLTRSAEALTRALLSDSASR